MEKAKESGPKVIERSSATAYIILGASLGLIIGFSFGFYLSNRWNKEAFEAKAASPKPGGPAAQGGGDVSQQMEVVRKHVDALKKRAAQDPKDVKSRVELGNMYYEVRKMDQAVEWYKQALEIEPNNVDVRTDLASAYFSMGQHDRAEAELQRSLSINPNHVNSLINLGIVKLSGRNDQAGALQIWEKVIGMNPEMQPGQLEQVKKWVALLKEGKNPLQR